MHKSVLFLVKFFKKGACREADCGKSCEQGCRKTPASE